LGRRKVIRAVQYDIYNKITKNKNLLC